MAAVAVLIARRDVTANWNSIYRLPASAQKMVFGERFLDRPETALACSGDPPASRGFQLSFSDNSSFFGKSVAPDGVLRIRICILWKDANRK